MTIIGLSRRASVRAKRGDASRRRDAPPTPVEARILALRAAGGASAPVTKASEALPGAAGHRRGIISTVLGWSLMLAMASVVAAATFVIDTGGHAAPATPLAATWTGSGTGRIPIDVAAGELTLSVSVRSDAVPWFWCLESSRALPLEQHLCGNSGEGARAVSPAVTRGIVRLDAAEVEGASFFIQTYCPHICDWRAIASVYR